MGTADKEEYREVESDFPFVDCPHCNGSSRVMFDGPPKVGTAWRCGNCDRDMHVIDVERVYRVTLANVGAK